MKDDERFFELEVNFDRPYLELLKPLKKFDFNDWEEILAYFPIGIKLYENDEQYNNKELIASIDGIFYDMDYVDNYGFNLFDVFDMHSGDTVNIYDILFDEEGQFKEEYETLNNNIFYLERIYVEKKYRKQGYAKLLLNQLEDIIKYVAKLNVGIIVVCSQPFEKEDDHDKMIRKDKELQRKLNDLYERVGFKKTGHKYNYLTKVIE